MKHIFLAIVAITMFFASCKKSDDNSANPGTTTSDHYWKTGTVTHTVNNYTTTSDGYYAYDKGFGGISFSFFSFPPAAGDYTVIGNTATLSEGKVKVLVFGSGNDSTYFATGSDHTSANVSFINGKIKVTLPDTWALKSNTGDSIKISANLGPLF